MSVKENAVYAAKLYIKSVVKYYDIPLYWITAVNFGFIAFLSMFIMGEHGDISAAEAQELGSTLESAFLVIFLFPFIVTAIWLSLERLLNQLTDSEDLELWPEVEV